MTLLLTRRELDGLLTVEDALEATRVAVLEDAAGTAVHMPGFGGMGWGRYIMRVVGGGLLGAGRIGVRAGGLLALFDADTSEPIAIMDLPSADLRLAASVGLAARYLARPEVSSVGLIGSGKIALNILRGICAARRVARVDVWSPTPEHRRGFADRATESRGIPVTAHDSLEPVLASEILALGTNARQSVVRFDQLRPGSLVLSAGLNTELDPSVYLGAAQLVATSRDQEVANASPTRTPGRVTGGPLHDLLADGRLAPDAIVPLGAIVRGDVAPRTGPQDIVVYRESRSGADEAALAVLTFERARDAGLGVEFDFVGAGTRGHAPSP